MRLRPRVVRVSIRSSANCSSAQPSPSSEVAVRYDGMFQAGPGPQSEKGRVSASQTEPRLI
jgi:hypothetical protein